MERAKEETLWLILAHLLERDDYLYSPDYIARLLIEEGLTDHRHNEHVFFKETLPALVLHNRGIVGVDFEEEVVISALHCYKKNIFVRILLNFITLFVSKKYWYSIMEEVRKEMEKLEKAPCSTNI